MNKYIKTLYLDILMDRGRLAYFDGQKTIQFDDDLYGGDGKQLHYRLYFDNGLDEQLLLKYGIFK